MIILLATSSIVLTALQASINAPREAFRACVKETSTKAASEKVTADAYESYVRNACSGQLSSLKGAVVKFDMSNKMSKKAADDDAASMVSEMMDSATERYKYVNATDPAPKKQEASAPKAADASPTPQPTPAVQPK